MAGQHTMKRCIILAFALLASTPTKAAHISRAGDNIFITGAIERDDDIVFDALAAGATKLTVYLNSPGGNAVASLGIGERVRSREYRTAVPPGGICGSGCALIWVAGQPRQLGHNARLQMHCAHEPAAEICDESLVLSHAGARADIPRES